MSSRSRRSEAIWDKKEESKLEASDGVMSSDFSGKPSWEPLQGNRNMPKDDVIHRDRRRMQADPTFDEREKLYSSRQLNDSYGGLSYRGRDRGVGGRGSMSRDRDRDRSRSPKQSRSRSRDRGRGVSRSRSRSRDRGRDWDSTRARSRSPFLDHKQESYGYKKESWSRRPDYSGGSRYGDNRSSADRLRNRGSDGYKEVSGLDEEVRDKVNEAYHCKDFMKGRCQRGASCRFPHHVASGDYNHKDDRNVYDDQDRRRQSNRNSRAPCRFFAAGKCNRDDCKFSHDVPEPGRYDGRSHNIQGRNFDNKNRTWNDGQPQDDLNASNFPKSNHNFEDKKKSWNGPSWDDVESGRFDKWSHDNVPDHTSDDKNRTWDASGFSNVPKSKHNSDGPSWDDVNAPDLDDKNRSWDGPSWDDVSASDLSNDPKPCHNSEDIKKSLNGTSRVGFSRGAKSATNIDGKTKPWNGPLWDDVSESGYASVGKFCVGDGMLRTDSKIRKWDGQGWDPQSTSVTNVKDIASKETGSMDNRELQPLPEGSGSHTLDGQAQDLVSRLANATTPGVSSHQMHERRGEDNVMIVTNDACAKNANMVSEDTNQQILTSVKDSVQGVLDVSRQSLSNLSGTEQSPHMLSLNLFNDPKTQLKGPVQGMFLHMDAHKQTEIQNKEGGKALGPWEVDIPRKMNDVNETSVIIGLLPQPNNLPALLPETSQHPQMLNLASAINFLNSFPNSASSVPCIDSMVSQHNQDSRPKEVCKSVKSSVPMGILENQMPGERFPPITAGGPNSSKHGGIGMLEKDYGKSPKTKTQEPVGNPEGTDNAKQEQENINPGTSEAQEGNISDEEKAMRQFKVALVEFVKEVLKPTWKEGKMSREVYKTVVKKVVDKVSSSIQGIQIPRTQPKIEQYLAFSKSKITKLVEAYLERFLKP